MAAHHARKALARCSKPALTHAARAEVWNLTAFADPARQADAPANRMITVASMTRAAAMLLTCCDSECREVEHADVHTDHS